MKTPVFLLTGFLGSGKTTLLNRALKEPALRALEWIDAGEPSLDLWSMDVRRFGPHYRSPTHTLARVRETYETYYDIRYPGHERESGRPLRLWYTTTQSAIPASAATNRALSCSCSR